MLASVYVSMRSDGSHKNWSLLTVGYVPDALAGEGWTYFTSITFVDGRFKEPASLLEQEIDRHGYALARKA